MIHHAMAPSGVGVADKGASPGCHGRRKMCRDSRARWRWLGSADITWADSVPTPVSSRQVIAGGQFVRDLQRRTNGYDWARQVRLKDHAASTVPLFTNCPAAHLMKFDRRMAGISYSGSAFTLAAFMSRDQSSNILRHNSLAGGDLASSTPRE